MRALLVAFIALALAPPAPAVAAGPTQPVYDGKGRLVETPFVPTPRAARLTEQRATKIFLARDKVADWLGRYPVKGRVTDAKFERQYGTWLVQVWWGPAGEVATGRVADATGAVTEAWTGPQVAWTMARGYDGAFGGRKINSLPIWLGFCAVFLLGLADLRRPLSLRNLDLLVLLSFTVSLWFFDDGNVLTSAPLAYPPLLYLLGRMIYAGWRGRLGGAAARPVWPVWVLAAAAVFLAGFRVGLNVQASNVIDVGYAGVIGANRISAGQSPYGHFPVEKNLRPCGPAGRNGTREQRIQANGRCEEANERGDTYGPVAYAAYLPGYWALGWSGRWDKLPAAHFTAIAFDLLCLLGLALVGRRFGGLRLAATLPFAWAAYPFTQYVSNSNTNDAIMPALLIWGFWLASSDWARGAFAALAGWAKFGALLVAPLWAGYPEPRPPRRLVTYATGFVLASAASFFVLLLEPNPLHAARVFWDRTLGWQIGRDSPFSIWDWRQYHAGLPDLHWLQIALEVALVAGSVALYFVPRRKSPLQLAALTAAVLLGFELVLTHWFYLYLPWFFPFVAFVVLAPAPARARARPLETGDRESRELLPVG
jgi:hypothetical protein